MKTTKALFGILTITAALLAQVQAQTSLIATLTMTFEQAQNLTTPVLPLGRSYFFRVTGRYGTGPGDRGEAMADAAWGTVITSTLDETHNLSCGWRWNGTCTNRPSPDVYQSNHVYNYYFVGRGAAEVLSFTDSYYGDNVGTLTFELYEIAHAPFTYGLVAYYPFNGNANDMSGNGNNGTAQTVTFAEVSNRLAATFTGAPDSSVTVPNSPSLAMTNAITVSLWFNLFGILNGPECLLDKAWKQPVYHDWSYRAWSSWYSGGWISFEGVPNNGSGPAPGIGVNPVNVSRWYHLVGIADGSNGLWQIYTNGILGHEIIVTPFTLSTGPFPLVIGAPVAQTDSAQKGFYGAINNVRIYNRALSADEVQQLYVYESGLRVNLIKAVKPSFSNLYLGTNYQLQVSGDMNTWTNHGSPFAATNLNMVYPQYWDVDNWGKLFFRVQEAP